MDGAVHFPETREEHVSKRQFVSGFMALGSQSHEFNSEKPKDTKTIPLIKDADKTEVQRG